MFIEEALVSHLKTKLSAKLYPLKLPQKVTYPAITYQKISGEWSHSMGGDSGYANPYYQFVSYAKTYAEVKQTAKQLRQTMQNLSGVFNGVYIQAVLIENEIEDYEDETLLYSVLQEYMIFYKDEI